MSLILKVLTQIPMLTPWDIVAKGVDVGAHELFTPKEIVMPNKLHTPAMDRQVKAVEKRADGLQSSWVDSWLRLASIGGGWGRLVMVGVERRRIASNGTRGH